METNTNSAKGRVITALIIGLIIGFALGALWQGNRADNLPSEEAEALAEENTTESEEEATVSGTENSAAAVTGASGFSIEVKDQKAGSIASIASVTLSKPVWVAIRETVDGKIGNILGAQKVFESGKDVAVELLRPTKAGGKYVAVVYEDVGSSAFNYREDVLVAGVQGEFSATE